MAAEKQVVPLACLHLHWDLTTRDGGFMAHEEWRDVAGYEGLYQVSNLGRVKSLAKKVWNGKTYYNKQELVMKPSMMTIGYYCVTLTRNAIQEKKYIHRLVAEAFIPNPHNYAEVDHIDANPTNNDVSNLRWVTHEENMRHIYELNHQYDGTANLHTPHARMITAMKLQKPVVRSDGKIFPSVKAAAESLNVNPTSVSNAARGRTKTCKGYTFKFIEKETPKNERR